MKSLTTITHLIARDDLVRVAQVGNEKVRDFEEEAGERDEVDLDGHHREKHVHVEDRQPREVAGAGWEKK